MVNNGRADGWENRGTWAGINYFPARPSNEDWARVTAELAQSGAGGAAAGAAAGGEAGLPWPGARKPASGGRPIGG